MSRKQWSWSVKWSKCARAVLDVHSGREEPKIRSVLRTWQRTTDILIATNRSKPRAYAAFLGRGDVGFHAGRQLPACLARQLCRIRPANRSGPGRICCFNNAEALVADTACVVATSSLRSPDIPFRVISVAMLPLPPPPVHSHELEIGRRQDPRPHQWRRARA